jgi:dihydroorotate dehydrogenase
MKKAFDEGWGGVICKTLSLDSSQVNNVTPRYGRMKASDGQVIGWENIELISDRPFPTMLQELKQLKEEYPDRCASHFTRRMCHACIQDECLREERERTCKCAEQGADRLNHGGVQ